MSLSSLYYIFLYISIILLIGACILLCISVKLFKKHKQIIHKQENIEMKEKEDSDVCSLTATGDYYVKPHCVFRASGVKLRLDDIELVRKTYHVAPYARIKRTRNVHRRRIRTKEQPSTKNNT